MQSQRGAVAAVGDNRQETHHDHADIYTAVFKKQTAFSHPTRRPGRPRNGPAGQCPARLPALRARRAPTPGRGVHLGLRHGGAAGAMDMGLRDLAPWGHPGPGPEPCTALS